MNKNKLLIINFIILFLFVFTTIYYYYSNLAANLGWPFNTYLFSPNARFGDFLSNYNNLSKNITANYQNFDYLPLFNLIHYIYSRVSNPYSSLFIYTFIPIFLISVIYYYKLKNIFEINYEIYTNLIILILLSYPIIFASDRGNAELYCFLLTTLFIFLFEKQPKTSIIFYSASLLIKPFGIVFFALLLKKDRRYLIKYFIIIYLSLLFILYFILINCFDIDNISLFSDGGGSYYNGYTKYFIIGNYGLGYGHSIFGMLKILGYSFSINNIPELLYRPYFYFSATIYFLVCLIIYRSDSYWKDIMVLTGLMCLLPYVSADYKLLHFLTAIILFVLSNDEKDYKKISVLLGLIVAVKPLISLAPLNISIIPEPVGLATLFTPLCIIILLFYVIKNMLPNLRPFNPRS